MTNYDRWRYYCENLPSPDSYIDFGFYYLIAAALQRCVWIGGPDPEESGVFANIYPILVGEPGLGKGEVLKEVLKFLKHWKKENPKQFQSNGTTPFKEVNREEVERKILETELEEENFKRASEQEDRGKTGMQKKIYEKPTLIPTAPDDVTYEGLVYRMAQNVSYKSVYKWDKKLQKKILGTYTHCSTAFCLEEASSLFREKQHAVVNFLIRAYDCGDYEKDTKTQGRDYIKRICLNFMAGTTPGFMNRVFGDELLTEGFASRSWFLYETQNRFSIFFRKLRTAEQESHKEHILNHLKNLTHLYGNVTLTPDAIEFCEAWVKEDRSNRVNTSIKLRPYYARKNLHMMKLAMILHFAENADPTQMQLNAELFIRANQILEAIEKRMHHALGFERTNPIAAPAKKIHQFLLFHKRRFTFNELLIEFFADLPVPVGADAKAVLGDILDFLILEEKALSTHEMDVQKEKSTIYYEAFREREPSGTSLYSD